MRFIKDLFLRANLKAKRLLRLISEREAIFLYVYQMRDWGSLKGEKYYSGGGSDERTSRPYIDYIGRYIKQHKIKSVVDLGCGDFRVSRNIDLGDARYIGVDIVKNLIKYNNKMYRSRNVEFRCLDIVDDELPRANLCLIKQALQHLCNKDILKVLKKLYSYQHILILDGFYQEDIQINQDIPNGDCHATGLYLEKPPFNCETETLLKYSDSANEESFRLIKLLKVNREQ